MNKFQLEMRGWTIQALRERIAGCRKGIAEAKARGGNSVWTYRYLFCRMYLGYKRDILTLQSN